MIRKKKRKSSVAWETTRGFSASGPPFPSASPPFPHTRQSHSAEEQHQQPKHRDGEAVYDKH